MTVQRKNIWKSPGAIAFIAAVLLANCVFDWLWFKPDNIFAFFVIEAVISGLIVLFVIRKRPPEDGGGGADTGDVANLVP